MLVRPEDLESIYKTDPRDYQSNDLLHSALAPVHFALWEQGLGKSKRAIDQAAYLFRHNMIDALLVLAPNGAHYNFVDNELPKHMGVPYKAHAFDNNKDTSDHKEHAAHLKHTLEHDPDQLVILSVSYPALLKPTVVKVPDKGPEREQAVSGLLYDFCKNRRVMIVGDELATIKNPEGKQAIAARAVSSMCRYRLGLEGVPIDQGPFDLYAIMMFGDPTFWVRHGIGSYKAFLGTFGMWESNGVKLYKLDEQQGVRVVRQRWDKEQHKHVDAFARRLVAYKNIDLLKRIIGPYISRLTKKSVGMNLPERIYSYEPFRLTREQQKVYDAFERDGMADLHDGSLVTSPSSLTKDLRLLQICSGYLPADEDATRLIEIDPGKNPRLDALVGLVDRIRDQGMIWAAFRPDRDKIIDALGDRVICYRSEDSDDQKKEAIKAWEDGDYQFILGHTCGGLAKSWTFTHACVGIHHTNLPRHNPRKQADDRMHRYGQVNVCNYYDILSRGTRERKVIDNLIAKNAVAAEILGDEKEAWLT